MNFQYPDSLRRVHAVPGAGGGRGGGRARGAPRRRRRAESRTARRAWRTASRRTSPSSGRRRASATCRAASAASRMPAQNLNHFTATTGPAIFRGDALPADLQGRPALHRAGRPPDPPREDREHRRADAAAQRLSESEFLTSDDQLFRPVNISNAPGRHASTSPTCTTASSRSGSGRARARTCARRSSSTSSTRSRSYGRIWRLRYDGRAAVPATAHQHRAAGDSGDRAGLRAAADVQRDAGAARRAPHAPERLVARHGAAAAVLKQDKSVVPALQQMARIVGQPRSARFHALWTLEGLGALDAALVRER